MEVALTKLNALITSIERDLHLSETASVLEANPTSDGTASATTQTPGYLSKLDAMIRDLESALGLGPGQPVKSSASAQGQHHKAPSAVKSAGITTKAMKESARKQTEKAQAATEASGTPSSGPDITPTDLELRVGRIVKVWEHPDSEKLFCEEIDLGEKAPRLIASGLRAFYQLSDLQDRMVVVTANLKGRNLGGFKSEGMVMCASTDDHTSVKFVDPPAGAKIGDLVTFPGLPGTPISAAQMVKRKVLPNILPLLRTDSSGTPGFMPPATGEGAPSVFVPFTIDGVGVCTTELPNAAVA